MTLLLPQVSYELRDGRDLNGRREREEEKKENSVFLTSCVKCVSFVGKGAYLHSSHTHSKPRAAHTCFAIFALILYQLV